MYLSIDLTGEVSKCTRFLGEGSRRYLELTFPSQDAAKYVLCLRVACPILILMLNRKALCMTGYNVAGVPL